MEIGYYSVGVRSTGIIVLLFLGGIHLVVLGVGSRIPLYFGG